MAEVLSNCPLDVDDGLARAGGEMDFYRELLDLLLEDVPPRIEDLRAAVQDGDAARTASIAHAIKGAAANLSAVPLRELAFAIEMKGREGTTAGVEPLVVRLVTEFDRLVDFVKQF